MEGGEKTRAPPQPPHIALICASSNQAPSLSQAMNLVSSTAPPLGDLGGEHLT